jgi:hypothetical protein
MTQQPFRKLNCQFGDERLLPRFWARVHHDDGCWMWTGTLNKGYGMFSFGGKTRRAHRFAYEALVGPIPEGLALDHLCRNPACVNPAHLEPVTWRENVYRGAQAKLTMEKAREIRARIVAGESAAPLSREYGVSLQVIWEISEDRTWREDTTAPRQPVRAVRDCADCGGQIPQDRHRAATYCSDLCKQRAYWKRRGRRAVEKHGAALRRLSDG